MTLDCSALSVNVMQSNESNQTDEIWLQEDFSSVFNPTLFNWREFLLGIGITIVISICLSVILSVIIYPAYDKKQKMIQLKIVSVTKKMVIPYLNKHCDFNKDVMNVIFEFSDISSNVNIKYSDLKSSITKQLLYIRLLYFIGIGTILIFSYIPIHLFIVHLNDSYNSYIEVKCIPISTSTCHHSRGNIEYSCGYIWQFDMDSICNYDILNLDNYVFYGQYKSYHWNGNVESCFINKYNFKIRGNGCDCWGKCGNCCSLCDGLMDSNCCCYTLCIMVSITIFVFYLWFIFCFVSQDFYGDYNISISHQYRAHSTDINLSLL
eukprot:112701_1